MQKLMSFLQLYLGMTYLSQVQDISQSPSWMNEQAGLNIFMNQQPCRPEYKVRVPSKIMQALCVNAEFLPSS
jgi:hypothetical protein